MTKKFKESKYKGNYAFEIVAELLSLASKGQHVTLVGLKGSGRSNLLRYLVANKEYGLVHKNYHNRNFVYIDCNTIFGGDMLSLSILIAKSLLDEVRYRGIITIDRYESLLSKLLQVSHIQAMFFILDIIVADLGDNHYHLIFDGFEKILNINDRNIYVFLSHLRDMYAINISYLFSVDYLDFIEVNTRDNSEISSMLNHQVFYMPLISLTDLPSVINRFGGNKLIKKDEIKKLHKMTGGYPAYLKYYETHVIDDQGPELDIISLSLLNSLSLPERRLLEKITKRKEVLSDEELYRLDFLSRIGLVRKVKFNYVITSNILKTYIENKGIPLESSDSITDEFVRSLTPNEALVFSELLNNKDKLVSKQTIAELLWGINYRDKYSQWAIDQLMKRLRDKSRLSMLNFKIHTNRGRGYTMN